LHRSNPQIAHLFVPAVVALREELDFSTDQAAYLEIVQGAVKDQMATLDKFLDKRASSRPYRSRQSDRLQLLVSPSIRKAGMFVPQGACSIIQ
jgi:hypothetical protein